MSRIKSTIITGSIGLLVFLFLPSAIFAVDAEYNLDNSIKFTGESSGDQAGGSVAACGDINGDGYNDMVVGAPAEETGGSVAGAVYIIFGGEEQVSIDLVDADVKLIGESAGDAAGTSVDCIGDYNGDGYDDIVIGAIGADTGFLSAAGAAYVVLGSSDMGDMDLSEASVKYLGEAMGDAAGTRVAGVGDVDGDGYDDFMVAAPGEDSGGTNAGAVYLFKGDVSPGTGVYGIGNNHLKITGESAGDMFGSAIDGVGDVDSDGFDDMLIGASEEDATGTNAGAALLFLGRDSLPTSMTASEAEVDIFGENEYDLAGTSLTGGKDVNGDGFPDIIIGAPGARGLKGAAYVVFGGDMMDATISLSDADTVLVGEEQGDAAGTVVAMMWDLDDDGYDEMVVNSSLAASSAGVTYIMFGAETFDSAYGLDSSNEKITGQADSDVAGSHLSVGDFNDDNYDDLILGAESEDSGGTNAGAVYLAYSYVDGDGDGIASDGGLVIGTDCDDENSAVSEEQTFYIDEDGDGLGDSSSSTTACVVEAPEGYVDNANDTDDKVANDGVEIPDDGIDNDGDGEIDEENNEENPHPEYSEQDPDGDGVAEAAIKSVSGAPNGEYVVVYRDKSIYRYSAFSITNSSDTKIKQYKSTAYYLILHPKAKKLAFVNALDGTVHSRATLSKKKKYTQSSIKVYKMRDKQFAVVTAKEASKVKVSLILINKKKKKLTNKDSESFNNKNVKPGKTKNKKNNVIIRNKNAKKVKKYLVTKKFQLKEK